MNVLFVCRNNTARSQVAMEFYKRLSDGEVASGGTLVEEPEKTVSQRPAAIIIQAMQEYGIDISDNRRIQLTEPMLDGYDKIIVMAEPDTIPSWLATRDNVTFWDVIDIKDKPIEVARELRDQILDNVGGLLGYTDHEQLVDKVSGRAAA